MLHLLTEAAKPFLIAFYVLSLQCTTIKEENNKAQLLTTIFFTKHYFVPLIRNDVIHKSSLIELLAA